MKIKYAIMSCNSDPMYLDFWTPVSKIWKLKFNIEPILVYINDKDANIDTTYGQVIKIDPIDNYPISLQAQFARIWYTQFLDDITIISDIDMFPISKQYFVNQIAKYSDYKYIHLNPSPNRIYVCYNVAHANKFKEVLELKESFKDNLYYLVKYKMVNNNETQAYWCADEDYLTEKVLGFKNQNDMIYIQRINHFIERIDRSCWHYDINDFSRYCDSHSLRPYSKYKDEIDKLVNIILSHE